MSHEFNLTKIALTTFIEHGSKNQEPFEEAWKKMESYLDTNELSQNDYDIHDYMDKAMDGFYHAFES
jgi:hypothetical protein